MFSIDKDLVDPQSALETGSSLLDYVTDSVIIIL